MRTAGGRCPNLQKLVAPAERPFGRVAPLAFPGEYPVETSIVGMLDAVRDSEQNTGVKVAENQCGILPRRR
jgi:hypothetical protein